MDSFLSFTLRRFLSLFPVGLGVVILVSVFLHLIPGDPVEQLAGSMAPESEKALIRASLGLDQPLPHQIKNYVSEVLKGNLGESILYHRPVLDMIRERMVPTLELALAAMVVALLISIPLGLISAVKANTPLDFVTTVLALVGVSIPNFWLGPLLVLYFSLKLNWLPVSERLGVDSYILPSIVLGSHLAAVLMRMTRTSVLENLREDYVRTARAKGLKEPTILIKHVLKNAAIPIVTLIGLQFGVLLTGAIITEKIFDWPGLGTLILSGIENRDYPVVQGCVLVFSCTYLIVNFFTDLAYATLDPRMKIERRTL